MFWGLLFGLLLLLAVAGMVYIVRGFHRFGFIQRIAEKNKKLSWLIACVPVFIFALMMLVSGFATIVGALHLMLFWGICDLIAFIIRKVTKGKSFRKYVGATAIVITTIYLAIGWYYGHHVFETSYSFETKKELGAASLRIVQIADSHLGVTLDGEEFAEQMERVQRTNPDVVVVTGDFVDDDSNRDDMVRACEALGELKTSYGVYFVFGNHDKGYFEGSRDFSEDDLREELEKNNVIILDDEVVLVANQFYIIGRKDRSDSEREAIGELVNGLDNTKYMVVLDHQPNDYDNEEKAEVDLVLSGHTHGGHVFPAGYVGLLMGANDKVYGTESRGNTDFVVTSGISGWAIPFKTGAISEYVVIDIISR